MLQYHRPKEQDGMVVAFRRPGSKDASFLVRLREIDPAGDYDTTTSYGYERSAPVRCTGPTWRR